MDHVIINIDGCGYDKGPKCVSKIPYRPNGNNSIGNYKTVLTNAFINGAKKVGVKHIMMDRMDGYDIGDRNDFGRLYNNYKHIYHVDDETDCNSDKSIETSDDDETCVLEDAKGCDIMFSDDEEEEDDNDDYSNKGPKRVSNIRAITKQTTSSSSSSSIYKPIISTHKKVLSVTNDSIKSPFIDGASNIQSNVDTFDNAQFTKVYVCFCVESKLDYEKIEKIYMNDNNTNEKPGLLYQLSFMIPSFFQSLFYEGRQHCEIGIYGYVFTIYRGKYVKRRKKYPSSNNYTYLCLDVPVETADCMFKLASKLARRKCGYDTMGLYFNHIPLLSWMYSTDYTGKRLSEKKFTCSSLVCYILEKGGIIKEYPPGKNVNNTTPDDLENMLVDYCGFTHTTHVSSKKHMQKHQSSSGNESCKTAKIIKK